MNAGSHIKEDDFIALLCEELSSEKRLAISGHVNQCHQCSGELEAYKTIFDGMQRIFLAQKKHISPSRMHDLLLEEIHRQKIYYARFRFDGFFPLSVAKTQLGIVKIFLGEFDLFKLDEKLAKLFPGKMLIHSEHALHEFYSQMEEYLKGTRKIFDLKQDKMLIKGDFQSRVLSTLAQVKYGDYITYGELAKRINQPKASRAVGNALGRNPLPILIPCHRVLAGDGLIGGFTGGIDIKEKLLKIEKVLHTQNSQQLSLF
ncbi:MAG: methylated-DNA--[protein]-cysteine S-methyltransferase [Deferribacteres bacterium]|nr:methylated-DNA--[protein]-cysteine S-methyltransferase [candidate division KSB1 bacterium]MCB9502860.1 methylated-DNA--[protein]-cysteine S-methyltransferase [Deferribacteres bacterium]